MHTVKPPENAFEPVAAGHLHRERLGGVVFLQRIFVLKPVRQTGGIEVGAVGKGKALRGSDARRPVVEPQDRDSRMVDIETSPKDRRRHPQEPREPGRPEALMAETRDSFLRGMLDPVMPAFPNVAEPRQEFV